MKRVNGESLSAIYEYKTKKQKKRKLKTKLRVITFLTAIAITLALMFSVLPLSSKTSAKASSGSDALKASNLITHKSVGVVQLGMTVAQARRALRGFTLKRTSDGEGVALIAALRGKETVMTFYAGEENPDARINERAKIEFIEVWDASYKTADGIHAKMPLSEVENRYGKVTEIMLSEIESREFATFAQMPKGITFRLMNNNGMAGIYSDNSRTTMSYSPSAYIFSISISGRGDETTKFSSAYTNLATQCKNPEPNNAEAQHISNFCKGYGNYFIHIFDSATTLQINAETSDRQISIPLASQSLNYVQQVRNVEWRMADGKPFAVIMRVFKYRNTGEYPFQGRPISEALLVKGLQGYESINYEVAVSPSANEKARELADGGYDESKEPKRIKFASGDSKAIAEGEFTKPNENVYFVMHAEAGQHIRLTVIPQTPGLATFGVVISPSGDEDGTIGGRIIDWALTETGNYKIRVGMRPTDPEMWPAKFIVEVEKIAKDKSLEMLAKNFMPKDTNLAHKVIEGEFGSSKKNVAVLYYEDKPAKSYKGLALVPDGDDYKKFVLPEPEFTWSMEEPKAVFFANADLDAEKELFIIGECYTGIGPTGAQPFNRTRVYDWNGNGFIHLESISEKIGTAATAVEVRKKLATISTEPSIKLSTEGKIESYEKINVTDFNKSVEAAFRKNEMWTNSPTQIALKLVGDFDEIKSRIIEIVAPFMSDNAVTLMITDDGLADDSVRSQKYKIELKKNESDFWEITSAQKTWRCWQDRGHQDYSVKPCI